MGNKSELEQIISDIKRRTSQIAINKVDESMIKIMDILGKRVLIMKL